MGSGLSRFLPPILSERASPPVRHVVARRFDPPSALAGASALGPRTESPDRFPGRGSSFPAILGARYSVVSIIVLLTVALLMEVVQPSPAGLDSRVEASMITDWNVTLLKVAWN